MRAAAFALGAVQAMQERRQLFVGPRCAHYLAAVSGGSYTAAAFALNAEHLGGAAADPPPLAVGSPEAAHIVANGDYLKRWGRLPLGTCGWITTLVIFGLFLAVNLAGFVSLFAVTAGLLVGVAAVTDGPMPVSPLGVELVFIALAVAGIWLLIHSLYRVPRPSWRFAVAGVAILAGAPALVTGSEAAVSWASELLDEDGLPFGAAAAAIGLYLALALAPFGSDRRTKLARSLSTLFPRTAGVALLAIGIERVSSSDLSTAQLIVGSPVMGALSTVLLSRISLNRLVRDRLARCFAVRRDGEGIEYAGPNSRLSELAPPGWPERGTTSFPRLLICATANIRRRTGDKRGTFEPFTFSHDSCWLPRDVQSSFETSELEEGSRPAWRSTEPVVSLMSAISSSGAAVSPSMGSKTQAGLRSAIALVNLRLGAWYPNPISTVIQKEVEAGTGWWRREHWWQVPKHLALGGGYDEFVPELFGLEREDAPRVYVSDGGHYDNLGLIMLLRAQCEEIWCVDSQADRKGEASQLANVIGLAEHYGYAKSITIDLATFQRAGDWHLGMHAIGEIEYPDGKRGTLVVVKLGLTSASCDLLKAYHQTDGRRWGPLRNLLRFPHDSTFLRVAFSSTRTEAYRQLGYDNTVAACADVGAAPGSS